MSSPCFLLPAAICFAATLGAAEPATLPDAIAAGRWSLNLRARYEGVEQTALRDAEALTLRTRLGFTTAAFHGWKAMVEGENIVAADGDRYSQSGLNPDGAGRAVVADPETTELNQAWLAYSAGPTLITVGKQRLVLDNTRFVGDVGWRQNMQTFDAVVVQDKSFAKTTLTYAYLDRVDRVFSGRHPQGRWDSDSHLFNASFAGLPAGTVTAYAYLLDFKHAAANSCATFGVSLVGERAIDSGFKFTYRAELAHQTDYGSSPLNYATHYAALEVGGAGRVGSVTVGYEVLGSDRGTSFRTPLATLHAFNGWADLFLTTPANGLRDTYLKATATLPAAIAGTVVYHWYTADRLGANYGRELNLQLSRKLGAHVSATAKYARFDRELASLPDVTKYWLQLDFAY